MRIFKWMFNKRNGLQETSRRDCTTSSVTCNFNNYKMNADLSIPNTCKEECIHWTESLLSIGTFGDLKETKQESFASDNKTDLSDLTSEEVSTLVKRLEIMDSTKDQFLDCSTSFPNPNCENYRSIANEGEIILSKGKDLLDETPSVLKKRSISFFIKKMFTCHAGFAPVPAPQLRDPFSQSVMEKLLKSILRKKIYPQNAMVMPTDKYLLRKHQEMLSIEAAAAQQKGEDGEKWVKTDSEYIVLEI